MSGTKGRSGGARRDSGPQPQKLSVRAKRDPRHFLMAVMNDADAGARVRIEAAKALMPYLYGKKGEGGKKDEQRTAAEKAGKGRFAAPAAPRLALVKR